VGRFASLLYFFRCNTVLCSFLPCSTFCRHTSFLPTSQFGCPVRLYFSGFRASFLGECPHFYFLYIESPGTPGLSNPPRSVPAHPMSFACVCYALPSLIATQRRTFGRFFFVSSYRLLGCYELLFFLICVFSPFSFFFIFFETFSPVKGRHMQH